MATPPLLPRGTVSCAACRAKGGRGCPGQQLSLKWDGGGASVRVTLGEAVLRSEPAGLLALTAEGCVLEVKLERELRVF